MNPNQKSKLPPAPRWDLESIFPGGSNSTEYEKFRLEIKEDLEAFGNEIQSLPQVLDESCQSFWVDFIIRIQKLQARLRQANSFVHCLICQDVKDEKGHQIAGEIDEFNSVFEKIEVSLEAFAKKQSDEQWRKLLEAREIGDSAFYLKELRDIAKKKMDPEYESLVADLAVNGYHAWNRLYDKMYGDLSVEFDENNEVKKLSIGQLNNKMATPDREIRKQAFTKLEEAWESVGNLASMTLNYMAGFRLKVYERRGWNSFLSEALQNSRICEDTLNAMWAAVDKKISKLEPYVEAKKKIMNTDKFCWYDQFAPLGSSDKLISFEDAGKYIVKYIRPFSEEMADFSKMALDKRWVEAEDRPGKAGGGWCTGLPVIGETRIFMTYGGSFSELATLAHELGHSWHNWVLKDKPLYSRIYPMTLAETASIFNELMVKDAALMNSTDRNEKLMLLDQRLQDAQSVFCNIYARLIFEKAFYTERKEGLVSKTRLDKLMVDAQKKGFGGMLDKDEGYHPLFWASKLHFYLTDAPFYNYPYTFGYLFATGVYNRAKQEGSAFAKQYKELLADTGKMTSEEVAMKHLGVDLTKEDFWAEAVDVSLEDVEPFVKLVNELS